MADALASGASVRKDVGVQVPPRALRPCELQLVPQVNGLSVARIGHDSRNFDYSDLAKERGIFAMHLRTGQFEDDSPDLTESAFTTRQLAKNWVN